MIDLYFDQGRGPATGRSDAARARRRWSRTRRPYTTSSSSCEAAGSRNVAERAGRAQDAADGGTLETLRRDGYM